MTTTSAVADADRSVLVYAPVGRDTELTVELLGRAAIPCRACASLTDLGDTLTDEGAGAILLTEEALDANDFPGLVRSLERQPAWSDVPVLLFAGGDGFDMSLRAIRSVEVLRNVTLLDRPVRVAAVVTTVRAALRSRGRQYEVRDLLVALHRARAEAEGANRLKDEFLATLSHELRTPLNAVLGWTSMLTRGQVAAERLPRVFEALDRNAQSQAQLIADVLDVSRIITGKLQLQLTVVDIGDVVMRAVDAVRPAAMAKAIQIDIGPAPGCVVNGDPDRLQQVFWNLLSNAIKFTPAAGRVRITVSQEADSVVVETVDSGVGIAPDFLPFVFDRFRQADQTTTRTHGGLGLGLSLVKHLTELHGGEVAARSDGRGRGASFIVRLPVSPLPAPRTAPPGLAAARLDGLVILVVDDDESSREVVRASLEAAHAEVEIAASADQARAVLQRRQPAVIVADLGMPGEDGFAFIRRVRESVNGWLPAIALSAYADAASRRAALDAGFSAFLAKPARPQQLVALVWAMVNRDEGTR